MDVRVYRHMDRETYDVQYETPTDLPLRKRDNFLTVGKPIQVKLNSYTITKYPEKNIAQYDVSNAHAIASVPTLDDAILERC